VTNELVNINIDEEESTITKELQRLSQEYNYVKLIGGLITIFIALGLSFQLDLLYTWIPASFLLMFLWLIYSTINITRKGILGDKANENLKIIKQFRKPFKMYIIQILFKNLNALMKAITVIYLVNIGIVLLHLSGKISLPFNGTIELISISLISIYFSVGIFLVDRFTKFVDKKGLPVIQSLKEYTAPMKIGAVIFFVLLVVIPGWIFFMVVTSVGNWWFLLIVLFIQIITIILLFSFFSLQQVKAELHRTLNNLLKIKEGQISEEVLSEVVKFSRYDIDETFKVIQIFLFRPHPVYLEEVKTAKHKRKSK